MTKASVRGMDTIQNFFTSDTAPEEVQALQLNPSQFFLGGASKRGWTTWTTAAVDQRSNYKKTFVINLLSPGFFRVIGILPVVMDELNFVENIKHHYRSYGGWSFALDSYYELNLTTYFDSPKMQEMFDIIDVFEYGFIELLELTRHMNLRI